MLDDNARQFNLSTGPRRNLPTFNPAGAVSFGMTQARPVVAAGVVNLTGSRFCQDTQMLVIGRTPAYIHEAKPTEILYTTTEDHQSWTDTRRD